MFFCIFIFYFPNVLGHPDNYIPADPMQTPAHIVPEWYFLRAPSKLHTVFERFTLITNKTTDLIISSKE